MLADKIRESIQELRPFIDVLLFQDFQFALSDFELYMSGDAYCEGDEYKRLMTTSEDLLTDLYDKADDFHAISEDDVVQLQDMLEDFFGNYGYDWSPREVEY